MDLEQNTTVYQTKVSCSPSEIHGPKLKRKNEVPWNCLYSSAQSKSLNTKQVTWTHNTSLTIESLGWRILFVILSFSIHVNPGFFLSASSVYSRRSSQRLHR